MEWALQHLIGLQLWPFLGILIWLRQVFIDLHKLSLILPPIDAIIGSSDGLIHLWKCSQDFKKLEPILNIPVVSIKPIFV